MYYIIHALAVYGRLWSLQTLSLSLLIILRHQSWFPVMNILRFEQRYLYEHLYSLFVLPPDSASLESLFELIGAMFQQTTFLAIDDSPFGFGTLSSTRLPYVAPRSHHGINSGLPRPALLFSPLLNESHSYKVTSFPSVFALH